ncbi:hypothetical protein WG954_18055 [Lacibacter sp. H375]|uniref:hypothetical protein n=1 Tax=Lacibacter sp. H375 TaxID=3133424 RepID=UPI0030BBC197
MSLKKFQIHQFAFLSISLFLVFIIISLHSIGQSFIGTYKNKDEYLRFENDSVYFRLLCCGGLYDEYEASGTYKIKRNKIIIEPDIEIHSIRFSTSERKKEDAIFFLVNAFDTSKDLASLILYDKNKNVIFGRQILLNQKTLIKQFEADKIDSITIARNGYITIGLKIDNNFNYQIELIKGKNKEVYESILQTKKGGFKFKADKNKISLFRPNPFKSGNKYFLITYEK